MEGKRYGEEEQRHIGQAEVNGVQKLAEWFLPVSCGILSFTLGD